MRAYTFIFTEEMAMKLRKVAQTRFLVVQIHGMVNDSGGLSKDRLSFSINRMIGLRVWIRLKGK